MAIPQKLDMALKGIASFDFKSRTMNETATISPEVFIKLKASNRGNTTLNNVVLHSKLKDALFNSIQSIKTNMISRFAIVLPYNEVQSMLMSDDTRAALQAAGKIMGKQYTNYDYKLGEKVTIRLYCRGGKEMPSILFATNELTNFSEDFLDLVRPLYLINKSWIDVELAFKTVCMLVQDTRELNFFVPWLRLIMPIEKDLANEYNSQYRVSQWLDLSKERHGIIDLITRQVKCILNNEHTNKRTWMPSELVQMVRQGEELISQYNIMKQVPVPITFLKEDMVSVDIAITVTDHPTIKWASEAKTYYTMKEANCLAVIDEENRRKGKW